MTTPPPKKKTFPEPLGYLMHSILGVTGFKWVLMWRVMLFSKSRCPQESEIVKIYRKLLFYWANFNHSEMHPWMKKIQLRSLKWRTTAFNKGEISKWWKYIDVSRMTGPGSRRDTGILIRCSCDRHGKVWSNFVYKGIYPYVPEVSDAVHGPLVPKINLIVFFAVKLNRDSLSFFSFWHRISVDFEVKSNCWNSKWH